MKPWLQHPAVHWTLVILVFCCTGLSTARLGGWIAETAGLVRFSAGYWFLWVVVLLPVYNVLLLGFAFIFGKFTYFRAKQLKMWRRVRSFFGNQSSS